MRKPRNGENTQAVVLTAARQVFAEHGFQGTSLAMISKACGISDGLILHHFQSKANLYHAVLTDLSSQYIQVIGDLDPRNITSPNAIDQTLKAVFQFWVQDEVYQRISLWAYLENKPEITQQETAVTTGLAAMLQQLQVRGKVDDSFAPFVLLASTIGPIHFWIRYRQQFQEALGLSRSKEELDAQFLDQFINLVKKCYSPQKEVNKKES